MSKSAPRAKLGSTGVFNKPPVTTPDVLVSTARPDRKGKTAMPFWVPVTARKQLRMLAAELDTTQQELMTRALNDLFEKHGKPRIA